MLDAIIPENADMALTGYIHERLPGFTTLITEKFLYVNTEDKFISTNAFHQGQVWKYLFKTSFLNDNHFTFDVRLRNGQDKDDIWVALNGNIYDVTTSRLWRNGKHYEHWAGQDLTPELKDAPHTEAVFEKFKIVGKLV